VEHKLSQDFVLFLAVVNPVVVTGVFLAVTQRKTARQKRRIATEAVLVAGVILLAFIALGQIVLNALEIEINAFRIAGGIILLVIAMKMVLEDMHALHPPGSRGNVAIFPLAIPFIAGPESILAAVLLTDNNLYTVKDQVEIAALLGLVLALTLLCLFSAEWVHKLLRDTGIAIINRVMGLILAALAVQFLITGLREAFKLGGGA
jgi:multiple antibiotic resistance protein